MKTSTEVSEKLNISKQRLNQLRDKYLTPKEHFITIFSTPTYKYTPEGIKKLKQIQKQNQKFSPQWVKNKSKGK